MFQLKFCLKTFETSSLLYVSTKKGNIVAVLLRKDTLGPASRKVFGDLGSFWFVLVSERFEKAAKLRLLGAF